MVTQGYTYTCSALYRRRRAVVCTSIVKASMFMHRTHTCFKGRVFDSPIVAIKLLFSWINHNVMKFCFFHTNAKKFSLSLLPYHPHLPSLPPSSFFFFPVKHLWHPLLSFVCLSSCSDGGIACHAWVPSAKHLAWKLQTATSAAKKKPTPSVFQTQRYESAHHVSPAQKGPTVCDVTRA